MSFSIAGDSPLNVTDGLFFGRPDSTLDRNAAERLVGQALAGSDDGDAIMRFIGHNELSVNSSQFSVWETELMSSRTIKKYALV